MRTSKQRARQRGSQRIDLGRRLPEVAQQYKSPGLDMHLTLAYFWCVIFDVVHAGSVFLPKVRVRMLSS